MEEETKTKWNQHTHTNISNIIIFSNYHTATQIDSWFLPNKLWQNWILYLIRAQRKWENNVFSREKKSTQALIRSVGSLLELLLLYWKALVSGYVCFCRFIYGIAILYNFENVFEQFCFVSERALVTMFWIFWKKKRYWYMQFFFQILKYLVFSEAVNNTQHTQEKKRNIEYLHNNNKKLVFRKCTSHTI